MKQSPNDPKHYQPITLANGLRVLLIQNSQSDKAAAALAVNVGHFSDPLERQGLAHFLEHMLFLGTEKYPDGSEYQAFISQFGGTHNAWTATEHTCFFFDIHHSQFSNALDRFSQFFITPLLSQSFIDKERQNIDSEFKLKLKDDIRRLYDVHKETINQQHPFAKFSVGNLTTLADRSNSSIRDELLQFFIEHYRANFMTLAIEGPQPLATLKNLAQQFFSAIPSADTPKKTISEPLYLAQHLAMKLAIKPVKHERKLIISFALPSIDHYYRGKPETIISYLLGHEGPGSIYSELKRQQWVMALSAGSGINGSNFKDFNVSVILTELGEQHIDEIIETVFCYLQLLTQKPIADYYYQEKKALAELSFQYQETLSPIDSVSQSVLNMQHYPEEDYIFGDYAMDGMNHDNFSELLRYFVSTNLRIIHVSPNHQCSQQSHWYKVPYQFEAIPAQLIQQWQQTQPNTALYLPSKNPYIIDHAVVYDNERISEQPQLIEQKNGLNIWFKQDDHFKVPNGNIYLGLDTPITIANTANIAMTRLFVELFTDLVTEQNYDAELAGMHYHLYQHQGGMTLQLSGLSENQQPLLQQLLTQLSQVKFSEQSFQLFKQQLLHQWQNRSKNKAIAQLFSTLSSVMQANNPNADALFEALTKVNFEQFINFYNSLFEHLSIDVLIHGNWQIHHAHQIAETINKAFNGKYHSRNAVSCPVTDTHGLTNIILPLILPDDDHASILYTPLPTRDLTLVALAMLTSHLLSPLFFQQMRTEKQYGYLVGVGYIPINRYPGLAMYIQSPHTPAQVLTKAMDEFIEQTSAQLSEMPALAWQQLQQGLASQLQEKDTSLSSKSQRLWLSLCNKDMHFNRNSLLIDAIQTCSLADLIDFIDQYLLKSVNVERINLISLKNKNELSHNFTLNENITTIADFSTFPVK